MMVREKIGGFASFRQVIIVKSLPKTRSGKVLRGIMRNIADGKNYQVPSTIEDIIVLKNIENILRKYKAKNETSTK